MAVHCNEADVDAVDFEQSGVADSVDVVCSKSRKEQPEFFAGLLCVGSRTRESAQA